MNLVWRVTLFSLLIMTSGKLAAEQSSHWEKELNELHELRRSYCAWYGFDQACGGNQAEMQNSNQARAQTNLNNAASTLSRQIIFNRQYETILTNLDSAYAQASDEKKATIEFLAGYLNNEWLNRYQPELDYWFSVTQDKHTRNLGLGYSLYAAIFAANPQPRVIKQAHKILRLRMPWTALSVGLAGSGMLLAQNSAHQNKPLIPPPPFHFLAFGNHDEPGADFGAQMSHAEYKMISDTFAHNAGVLAVLTMGPNWKALAAGRAATRFVFLNRALAATRVTPLSFIGSLVITELVKWSWSKHRANHLIEQIESFKQTDDHVAQEISLLINALHILFLAELDTTIRAMEPSVSPLLTSGWDDKTVAKNFSDWAISQPHFSFFRTDPYDGSGVRFVEHLAEQYRQFFRRADKLIKLLTGIQSKDPIMNAVIQLRVESLRLQRNEAQERFENFPKDLLATRLMKLYHGDSK